MKNLQKLLSMTLCGLASMLCLACPMNADERPAIEQEREMVGSKRLSKVEEATIVEQRIEQSNEAGSEERAAVAALTYDTYTVVHQGAFHNPRSVTTLGDLVELEDGSVWAVAQNDRYDTLDWRVEDSVLILPNHSWFSNYDYRLVNVATGASVRVNLSQAPYYNGPKTYYVSGIDYSEGIVYLNDGSTWRISYFDRSSILNNWKYNDTVIIGSNDDWISGGSPHILINVTVLNYARCQCLN